jgi:hypothetical protein
MRQWTLIGTSAKKQAALDAPQRRVQRAWGKTNESQVKNPKRHKKAGKESGNYDSMAA